MMRCLVGLALIAGCGDDPEVRPDAPSATIDAGPDATPLACGSEGTAVVNGGIGGETISTVRAIQTTLGGTPTILIDESGTGCGDVDVNTTDYLVLIYCAPSMVATYPLSGGTATGCPALHAGASFGYTANAAAHVEGSTGGTFSIESITSTCMTGSFSATFAGGQVSGNFAAIACP